MRTPLIAVAALLAAGCNSTDATANAAAPRAAAKSYAAVGIAPGMTRDQVEAKLKAQGYELADSTRAPDFAELKRQAEGKSNMYDGPRDSVGTQQFKKGPESLGVTYQALPGGPTVSYVSYFAGPTMLSYDEAVAELVKRYGSATIVTERPGRENRSWCSNGAAEPRACHQNAYLSVSHSGDRVGIYVSDEGVRRRQQELLRSGGGKASF